MFLVWENLPLTSVLEEYFNSMIEVFRIQVISENNTCTPQLKSILDRLNGKQLLHVWRKPVISISYGSEMQTEQLTHLFLFTTINSSSSVLKSLVSSYRTNLGYLVNQKVGDLDKSEKRVMSPDSLTLLARSLDLFHRSVELNDIDYETIESDISNLINLIFAPDPIKQRNYLLKRFLDYSSHSDTFSQIFAEQGFLKRQTADVPSIYLPIPASLSRTVLPKAIFDELTRLNRIQNELWMKMSYDRDFLLEKSRVLEKEDDFVARFTSIIRKTKGNKNTTSKKCSITRNDVMVQDDGRFFQVEFNMIASSLGPISEKHHHSLNRIAKIFGDKPSPFTDKDELTSAVDNLDFVTKSLIATHKSYGNPDAIIVFLCGKEKNVFDIFAPLSGLKEAGISFERLSFKDLNDLLEVDETTGIATVLGKEVALFYLRDGYMPHQYSDQEWETREKYELSKSIKCPDAAQQLVNMKYFQYVINFESTWTHFGYSKEDFDSCRKMFCDIKTIHDFKDGKKEIFEYIQSKGGLDSFVLKPQREGGANNFFGEDIRKQIDSLTIEQLEAFILMEKIVPRVYTNIHCAWDQVRVRETADEFGVFYFNLWDSGKVVENREGGTLVRSKINGTNEGGVGMGFAVINSLTVE